MGGLKLYLHWKCMTANYKKTFRTKKKKYYFLKYSRITYIFLNSKTCLELFKISKDFPSDLISQRKKKYCIKKCFCKRRIEKNCNLIFSLFFEWTGDYPKIVFVKLVSPASKLKWCALESKCMENAIIQLEQGKANYGPGVICGSSNYLI